MRIAGLLQTAGNPTYSSKQERDGWQAFLWTGRSSTPTAVWVRLHQKWQGVVCPSSLSAKASSGVAPVNIFFVRRCLQKVGFMASTFQLEQRAADQRVRQRHLVAVVLVRLGALENQIRRL